MSVEATGWAFRQRVPAKPKMVLLALADQADETTGRVCYGKTDMKHIAGKASCGERTLYRYIAALVRNGYVLKESGKDKGKASSYWLRMDREQAKSLAEWQWKADEDDAEFPEDDPQDVVGGSAILADPESSESGETDDQNGRGGLPHGGRAESLDNQYINAEKPSVSRKSSFSRKAQDTALENRSIAKAAIGAGAKFFVIEGSRAWNDWIDFRRSKGIKPSTFPTCSGLVNGQVRRGWYMPSLFPPSSSDPPQGLSDEDAKALTGN